MEQRVGVGQRRAGTTYRHRRHWLLFATALALASLLAACGARTTGTTSTATSGTADPPAIAPTTVGAPVPAATNAVTNSPTSGGGTITAVPIDGHALGGQDRLGAPGLGAFLFFDADG
jgi:hypothetical protein